MATGIGVVVAIAVIFVLNGLKIQRVRALGSFSPGTPDTMPR